MLPVPTDRDDQLLVMGLEDFSSGSSPLIGIYETFRQIGQFFQIERLIGERMTALDLEQARRSKNFSKIHVATHAGINPTTGKAYIEFYDRLLSLEELREIDWYNPNRPVDFLFLSACKTAAPSPDTNYGFATLSVQAGVKSVIATHWQISNQSANDFTLRFYRNLKNARSPLKAHILRQTQIEMIRSEQFRHPYYWAAYTMVGSPW